MKIRDWEIWFSYTTYLDGTVPDLHEAAKILIDTGLAVCAMHQNGRTYWRTGQEIRSGTTTMSTDDRLSRGRFRLKCDSGSAPDLRGFGKEAWFQAAQFRFGEMRLFREDAQLPPPYVRLFLGQFSLAKAAENCTITCYPVLKLYETGVLILELRVLSPHQDVDCEEFIRSYVDLPRTSFDDVQVPPGIAKLAAEAWHLSQEQASLRERGRLVAALAAHRKAVDELTGTRKSGSFLFDLAPLTQEAGRGDTFASISSMVFSEVAYLLGKPRRLATYLPWGPRSTLQIGQHWVGRRYIHLIRFGPQGETASRNEELHRSCLERIIAGSPSTLHAGNTNALPTSSRSFEDYGIYVSQTGMLWVWTEESLARQPNSENTNYGPMLYEHQALAELLDYAFILHRALLERVLGRTKLEDVLRFRHQLAVLKHQFFETSNFGEIQDLLRNGWAAMGMKDLQDQISDNLSIRESERLCSRLELRSGWGEYLRSCSV